MITDNIIFWILIGASTGFLYLKSQQWSVNRINPCRMRQSMRLIIGGTILRWLLVSLIMVIAISFSYQALWSVFISFITVRFLFLLKWQGWMPNKNSFTRQT